jgi:hypothetical protein
VSTNYLLGGVKNQGGENQLCFLFGITTKQETLQGRYLTPYLLPDMEKAGEGHPPAFVAISAFF